MSIESLLTRLEHRSATAVTAGVSGDVTRRATPAMAVTGVTAVTSENEYTQLRARLLSIAGDDRRPQELVHRLPADDLTACAGCTDSELLGYLRALDTSACMDIGAIPPGYSQAATCAGCGPVWLWPGVPAHVLACPWCFRRHAGKTIPRPPA
jgi:hypothetical protein